MSGRLPSTSTLLSGAIFAQLAMTMLYWPAPSRTVNICPHAVAAGTIIAATTTGTTTDGHHLAAGTAVPPTASTRKHPRRKPAASLG